VKNTNEGNTLINVIKMERTTDRPTDGPGEPGTWRTCNLDLNLGPERGTKTYSPQRLKRQPEEAEKKKASVKECGKKGKGKRVTQKGSIVHKIFFGLVNP